MKTIKMCALLMLIVISFSFVQAGVVNTNGSAIVVAPPTETTTSPIIQDNTPETTRELNGFGKALVIGGPIIILLIAFYLVKKKKKKKFREFDAQPKDISQKRLWKNAKMFKKKVPKLPKESVVILDESTTPPTISGDEQLIRSVTQNILKDDKKHKNNANEEAKAKAAINKILEEAGIRDKPGFDDPTLSGGSVTTYK